MPAPLEIFFSYAHEDEDLMNNVRRQLVVFERNERILKWHDRMIQAGAEWRGDIDDRLRRASIILLFMSPHFIESKYCYEVEGLAALERHAAGDARIIPVVLRPCSWTQTPFGDFQALPRDGRPVSRWDDLDEACLNVANGVMAVVDEITANHGGYRRTGNVMQSDREGKRPQMEADVVFCGRCGQVAGEQSICTGGYTHHEFRPGSEHDLCSRCGVTAGKQTRCTGGYTHHEFVGSLAQALCSRCGVRAGTQSRCTGGYTHHSFVTV